ncbi:MAG: YtxH domain-containing protein [Pseudoramibacter sp.]
MSSKESYFIGGIFAGAIIGAAAALLFAPSTGDDLRASIASGARETWDDLQDQIKECGHSLKSQIQDATDTLTDRVNQYRSEIEDKIDDIEDDIDDFEAMYEDEDEDAEDDSESEAPSESEEEVDA